MQSSDPSYLEGINSCDFMNIVILLAIPMHKKKQLYI